MQPLRTAFLLALVHATQAPAQLLINEVQPANHATISDARSRTPDWIELYNTGPKAVDARGMRLSLGGRTHVLDRPVLIAPGSHVVLLCGGPHTDVPFPLPRNGGTLLLIAQDGTTVLDLFSWPALPGDVSMGRLPDGARSWSFFERPTPGAANSGPCALHRRAQAPAIIEHPGPGEASITVSLAAPDGGTIRCTLDGSAPDRHAPPCEGPIVIRRSTVLRARTFAGDALPSEETVAAWTFEGQGAPALHIATGPDGLHGPHGIDNEGDSANHTRRGRAWERPCVVLAADPGTGPVHAGLRIAGSGSRSLPKRSLKLYGRERYGSGGAVFRFADGTAIDEAILRADATPHAFLRNLLMETLVHQHGLQVDMQPSKAVALHLNGAYHGLYRWMPAKDPAWLRGITGAAAVDVLDGPALVPLSGSGRHFQHAMSALSGHAPIDSIDALIDLQSLIDLACVDLWTGRADHDLNVRCHRPREQGGRWRWVLFDLDLWAPAHENSVRRLCSAPVPEPPYVPQLLAHPGLRQRLLARIAALHAAVFAPDVAGRAADSLHRIHRTAMLADRVRWAAHMDVPHPDSSAHLLRDFIAQRPAHLLRHLAAHTGHALRTITIDVPPPHIGTVTLEGLPLPPGERTVHGFAGVPMRLEARAAAGHEFAGWRAPRHGEPALTIDPATVRNCRPRFRALVP